MSGRRGSSSYPPRHSPYGGGGNRGYGGGGRSYDERNSHYGQHDGSRSPHTQSHPDNRYQSKSYATTSTAAKIIIPAFQAFTAIAATVSPSNSTATAVSAANTSPPSRHQCK
ncbi:hypothetical protein MRX96_029260 [Rhipicephalus microplus]